jgi:hypothetical protein
MRVVSVACAALCVIALSVSPARAQAQAPGPEARRADPRGGVVLGVNASYLTVPKDTGSSHSVGAGFVGGLFGVAPLTKTINIQPEILYSQRHSSTTVGTREFDKKVDYVSIPVLVRMVLFKGLYVTEGPAIHFPVNATSESDGQQRDFKANARTDVSIVIGVGKIVSNHAGWEVRWDSGLRQTEETVAAGEVVNRNRAITGLLVVPF